MPASAVRPVARFVARPLALAALVGLAGCSSLPFGAPDEPALIVESQPKGDGGSVNIASFTLAEPGYVVVHADDDGSPGPVIGRTELIEAGTYEDVDVEIDAARAGTRVYPMLHTDDGDGEYEFPGADAPTMFGGSTLFAPVDWL